MKTVNVNVYTGFYVDNEKNGLEGVAFSAVVDRNGKQAMHDLYGKDDTYMTIWLKGVLEILQSFDQSLSNGVHTPQDLTVALTVHMWHTNLQAIASKMKSVYESLKGFDPDAIDQLLDRKLLKKNRTRYDHHELQKSIIKALFSINGNVNLMMKFKPLPPGNSHMGTAYQLAQIHLENANKASNVVQLHG